MPLCTKCHGSGLEIVFPPLDRSADMGGWIAYWPEGRDGLLAYRRRCPSCAGAGITGSAQPEEPPRSDPEGSNGTQGRWPLTAPPPATTKRPIQANPRLASRQSLLTTVGASKPSNSM